MAYYKLFNERMNRRLRGINYVQRILYSCNYAEMRKLNSLLLFDTVSIHVDAAVKFALDAGG
jgi:aspartate/glutamate racemase